MTWQSLCAAILLAVGVTIELLSSLGLLAMDDVYQRLHYLGPAAVLGPVIIAAAVILEEALSTAGIKAILIAVVLAGGGPVVAHATARAARMRRLGTWQLQPGEHIEER